MTRPFDDTTRRNIARLCAAFTRAEPGDATPALKRASVAIALVEADNGEGTAFLLTRRAAGLRSHRAQWALPGGRYDPGETPIAGDRREPTLRPAPDEAANAAAMEYGDTWENIAVNTTRRRVACATCSRTICSSYWP